MKFLQLSNGYKVAYIDEGEGDQTILFIHGLGNYALGWRKNIRALKQYYRCIAIDLPGNGYSDRADFSYSMNFFAGCIYDFIRNLRLENVCLAGHSMGGQIAMTLLLNEPKAAERLILCAPAGFETFSPIERSMYVSTLQMVDMFSTDENSLRKSIRTSFYQFPQQGEDMIEELVGILRSYPIQPYRKMIDACIHAMLDEPVYDRLGEINQPTLVMYGERDALIPNRIIHPVTTRQIAQQGAGKLPNALLHMIPQCGHFLQLEKADIVNDHIRNFLG